MKRQIILSLLVIAITVFFSCDEVFRERIRGNGVGKTENRNVKGFSSVDVSGAMDVYVMQDSSTSVKVEADENLLQYIVTENDNGTLVIRYEEGVELRPKKGIRIYVSNPVYREFEASGACNYFGENRISSTESIRIHVSGACDAAMEVKAPKVKVDLSGAGTISLRGETKDFEVDGSGSTNIKCFDLMAENTHVDISGAGSAQVFASVKLDVEVSGAADVKYKGNPAINQSVSGAGSVKKAETSNL